MTPAPLLIAAGGGAAAALVAALALTPRVRDAAKALAASDRGRGRPPRFGGVAVVLATSIGFFLAAALSGGGSLGARIVVCGAAAASIGVIDDLVGARPLPKLAAQVAVALSVSLWFSDALRSVDLPIAGVIHLSAWGVPLMALWIVVVMNAMNLIDGLDGLATGLASIIVTTTLVVSLKRDDAEGVLVCATLLGALLGFLLFNWHPASIFLGDTGSLFIGMVLALLSITCLQKTPTALSLSAPTLLLGIPLADTAFAIVRRTARGRSILRGDRGHIHHQLVRAGLSTRRAVLVLYAVTALLGVLAVIIADPAPTALPAVTPG